MVPISIMFYHQPTKIKLCQGIDTSDFIVAESTIAARGTMGNTNDWTQTDPADGKVVIAWSYMEDYPYKDETTQFMADLRTVQNLV